MHIATQTLIPKGEEEEEAKQLIETLPPTMRRNLLVETEENRRKLAAEKEKREYYLFKISKLTGTEPSLYQKLTDQSNLLDITDNVPEDRKRAFYLRLMRRNNRILAVAARYQVPRDKVEPYLEAPDSMDIYTIQQILRGYRESSEADEPKFASRQHDAADTGRPIDYEKLRETMAKKVAEAKENCKLTKQQEKELKDLFAEFEDVMRIDIGKDDPPQNIDPYEVKEIKESKPRVSKARGHSQKATNALRGMLKQLEDQGLIYRNKSAHWASPAFLVPKPGKKDEYRLVVDLRYVNSQTLPISWEMPNLEHCMHVTRDATHFGTFDFVNGFWQIPLGKESQEIFSFVTPLGTYTPRRLPQGHHSSPLYFHAHLQDAFQSLIDEGKALLWIDDIVIFAKTYEEYMETLERFLQICRTKVFKVSAKKSTYMAREAHWCGRIIDGSGTRYHPRNYETMERLQTPTTAGELSQFCSALNWMSHGLNGFAEAVDPLRQLLEKIYKMVGSRERLKYRRVELDKMWEDQHQRSFDACKNLLVNTIKQAHYKPGAVVCLITDASDRFYAGTLTQVIDWEEGVQVQHQRHEILACMSGKFNETQIKWSTIEKESYPIVECANLWEFYLLNDKGVKIYTDHANIAHLFKPESIDPSLKRSSIDKIHRWLQVLSQFHITAFEHLKGEINDFCDLASRWGQEGYYEQKAVEKASDTEEARHSSSTKELRVNTRNQKKEERKRNPKYRKVIDELNKPSQTFPTKDMIRISQQFHYDDEYVPLCESNETFQKSVKEKEGLIYHNEVLWIPKEDIELQLRILTIAHCGENGHTGSGPTLAKIKKYFYWDNMEEDTMNFLHNCLCCEKLNDGNIRPLPWGEQTHAKERNEIVTFDYLHIQKPLVDGLHAYTYVLALKDEYSGLIELIPTKRADHHAVAEALAWWISRYGKPKMLRSDQGSHFKAKVLEELNKRWKISHEFTLVYSPWSNGAIEIVNKTILRALRSIILENNLNTHDWPYLLPIVQGVINGTISERLAGHCPREVFMGLKSMDPLEPYHLLYNPGSDAIQNVKLTTPEIEENLQDLIEDLQQRHEKVNEAKKRKREAQDRAHRKKYNLPEEDEDGIMIPDCDFRVGDYVLVALANLKTKKKLDAVWRGPFKVVGLVHTDLNARGDFKNRVYLVEHLVTKERQQAHARRIKFYADNFLDTQVDLEALERHITSQESTVSTIIRVMDYKFDSDAMDWMVQVEWHDGTVDNTSWEPLSYVLSIAAKTIGDYWRSLSWDTHFEKKKHLKHLLESNYSVRLAPVDPSLMVAHSSNKRMKLS